MSLPFGNKPKTATAPAKSVGRVGTAGGAASVSYINIFHRSYLNFYIERSNLNYRWSCNPHEEI
jgi:hypothetical protein